MESGSYGKLIPDIHRQGGLGLFTGARTPSYLFGELDGIAFSPGTSDFRDLCGDLGSRVLGITLLIHLSKQGLCGIIP